jgi:hypothetical protein
MRKIHLVGLALFAVLAYGAFAVTSAFADETARFLNNGNQIGAAEEIAVKGEGELTLTTLVANSPAVVVDCSGILHGVLLAGGLDLITELLDLENLRGIPLTALTGEGLNCTVLTSLLNACGAVGSLAELWAVNLPWLTVALLMTAAPEFLVDIVSSGAGAPGYYVLCINGKTNQCTGKTSFAAENEAGGIFNEFSEAAPISSEKGTCTEGGNGAGDIAGSGLTVSNLGSTITVSE